MVREGVDSGENKGEMAQRALLHVVPSPQHAHCRLMASMVSYEPELQQDCNPCRFRTGHSTRSAGAGICAGAGAGSAADTPGIPVLIPNHQ